MGDKHILTQALEGYSTLMVLQDQADLALRLAGATDNARKEMGAPLSALEKDHLDPYLEKARAKLEKKAELEFTKGQAINLAEVLEEVLEPKL